MEASYQGRIDIVAFLLQLPAVKASIDQINPEHGTSLSIASGKGNQPIVQLLLDAGADPTIPPGRRLPRNQAVINDHQDIAALLRHVIAEADRARALHKARCLLGAGAAALACLQGRVEQGQEVPLVELTDEEEEGEEEQQQLYRELQQLRLHHHHEEQHQQQQHNERLRATAAFAVGVSGGEKDTGLCEDSYLKLLGYMLSLWADKGPTGV